MVRLYNRAPPTGLSTTKLQWGVALQPQYWQHYRHKLRCEIDIHGAFSGVAASLSQIQHL
jgi:hypothetical protein